ncbi:PREDICTED: tyrosine-protein kinase hopscotch isoform X1 [Polistes dominula]|uniref:non-specific protein-tyrosine kinase n=1 Tax=Polistes dominula TaxID=743375 RepID=A0ABM1HW36_POLDO|nr:PREDICTED: tyrosine-protein kinase hopscotch isoform X1 [Polistes dominula]
MDRIAIINVVTDEKELNVSYNVGWSIEDLCTQICKIFGIGPVARHLFALRNHSNKLWYPANHKLENREKKKFDFRLRFKPASLQTLKRIDEKAYDYYFLQARCDVLENKVPDIVYERHKRELIGLGVSDMYRVMLEKGIPREIVESEYKKYIPKECIKRHAFFIKKPIHNALGRISGHDASYVKEQYLKQFECMAPNYPYEEYKALMDKGVPSPAAKIVLRVNFEEVKYCETESGVWNQLCAIEDLCFISIRQDNTVEVSRKNGIPSYLKFTASNLLMSFVSALDGYYRLAIKWTFNLCRDITTPSLERLHKLRCHGPVGKEFAYGKIEEKRANRPGSYIIRESETEYNVYYIDYCGKDGNITSQRIEDRVNTFVIPNSIQTFKSLGHFISSCQDSESLPHLLECLPPSEYDKSPLLICALEKIGGEVTADEEIIASLLEQGPRCVPRNQLKIYKTLYHSKSNDSLNIPFLSKPSPTILHLAMWHVSKGKKLEIAIKMLKDEESRSTKEFLELAGKWSQLRSSALVRLYGLTVTPTIGMLLELVGAGPLDAYLSNPSSPSVKTVDMVEAAACLATALWHLEENGVVHGNIRCKKLLVHAHTANSFIVKLTDPGLFTYTDKDIHWIPPELYSNLEIAKSSFQTDIWAVSTTIWQIFSKGLDPSKNHNVNAVKKDYESGKRLLMPASCPAEVYKLMIDCWGEPNGIRKQPQAIMRDINQILYQSFNSRRKHAYATAFPKLFHDSDLIHEEDSSDTPDDKSINSGSHASSLITDKTSLPWDDDDNIKELININESCTSSAEKLTNYLSFGNDKARDTNSCNDQTMAGVINCSDHTTHAFHDISHGSSIGDVSIVNNNCSSLNDLSGMPPALEFNENTVVVIQGRIGQGFYGEVYKGMLDKKKDTEPEIVAVKRLKSHTLEANVHDFQREISIMKTLKHPNVVAILGVITEPELYLIMEYVKHGSLQSYLTLHGQNISHGKLLGFALDIATGMDYLGQKKIVHRDLAARNILVADESRVKISDFGLAQVTGNNDYYILQTIRDLPIKWYAPESLRDGKFSARSDVWSFGVTMYEIFGLGEDPKLPAIGLDTSANEINGIKTVLEDGAAELLAALERGSRLPCPPNCPQHIYVKLIYPCWNLQSHKRPNFASLCKNIREFLNYY